MQAEQHSIMVFTFYQLKTRLSFSHFFLGVLQWAISHGRSSLGPCGVVDGGSARLSDSHHVQSLGRTPVAYTNRYEDSLPPKTSSPQESIF